MSNLSPAMNKALDNLQAQAASGDGLDLNPAGISWSTLIALRDRGLIDFDGVRVNWIES